MVDILKITIAVVAAQFIRALILGIWFHLHQLWLAKRDPSYGTDSLWEKIRRLY